MVRTRNRKACHFAILCILPFNFPYSLTPCSQTHSPLFSSFSKIPPNSEALRQHFVTWIFKVRRVRLAPSPKTDYHLLSAFRELFEISVPYLFQTDPGTNPASYTVGTGSFPGAKRPGRGVDHPLSSSAEVKERVELYLYSPSEPSWPVLGWTLPLPYLISVNGSRLVLYLLSTRWTDWPLKIRSFETSVPTRCHILSELRHRVWHYLVHLTNMNYFCVQFRSLLPLWKTFVFQLCTCASWSRNLLFHEVVT